MENNKSKLAEFNRIQEESAKQIKKQGKNLINNLNNETEDEVYNNLFSKRYDVGIKKTVEYFINIVTKYQMNYNLITSDFLVKSNGVLYSNTPVITIGKEIQEDSIINGMREGEYFNLIFGYSLYIAKIDDNDKINIIWVYNYTDWTYDTIDQKLLKVTIIYATKQGTGIRLTQETFEVGKKVVISDLVFNKETKNYDVDKKTTRETGEVIDKIPLFVMKNKTGNFLNDLSDIPRRIYPWFQYLDANRGRWLYETTYGITKVFIPSGRVGTAQDFSDADGSNSTGGDNYAQDTNYVSGEDLTGTVLKPALFGGSELREDNEEIRKRIYASCGYSDDEIDTKGSNSTDTTQIWLRKTMVTNMENKLITRKQFIKEVYSFFGKEIEIEWSLFVPEDETKTVDQIVKLVSVGVPIELLLQDLGWNDEKIKEFKKLQKEQEEKEKEKMKIESENVNEKPNEEVKKGEGDE